MIDGYVEAAQYHDLLTAARNTAKVRALVEPLADSVERGVLDIGAGTGAALVEAGRQAPKVPLYAVEPSTAMRTALYAKLVMDANLRARTTVYATTAERLELDGVADLALCLDTSPTFAPAYRPDIWERIHRALVPGGALLMDVPDLDEPVAMAVSELGRAKVGQHTLRGFCRGQPAGQRQWWEFQYVLRDTEGELVSSTLAEYYTWPAKADEVAQELDAAGFVSKETLAVGGRKVWLLRRG